MSFRCMGKLKGKKKDRWVSILGTRDFANMLLSQRRPRFNSKDHRPSWNQKVVHYHVVMEVVVVGGGGGVDTRKVSLHGACVWGVCSL